MRNKPKLVKIAIATMVERAASFQKLGRTKLRRQPKKKGGKSNENPLGKKIHVLDFAIEVFFVFLERKLVHLESLFKNFIAFHHGYFGLIHFLNGSI